MPHSPSMFGYAREDAVAGVVVFLVALPLCLGIAVACGVPAVSGIAAGIVGGLVVPLISRSPLSVSGPAAGLTSVVLTQVEHLGLERFLTAIIIAGGLQAGLGVLRSGRLSALVPSAVIKGMLAAIGITIVLKELPVAFGATGGLMQVASAFNPGALLLSTVALAILYGWRYTPMARLHALSPALVVVVVTSVLAELLRGTSLALGPDHFVNVPLGGVGALVAALPRPDLGAFTDRAVWTTGLTVAVVASVETLLSLQAVDRLDPLRRHSPPDRELLAQGAANVVAGLVGGLPVTAVIVRSGANVTAGARERLSAVVHGVLLLVAVLFAGVLLNRIPLPALAAILIQVGMGLSRPSLYVQQVRLGLTQMVPFAVTLVAVLAQDLLVGVAIGIVFGVGFVLYENSRRAIVALQDDEGTWRIRFRRDGTFVAKPDLIDVLDQVDDGSRVIISGSGEYIDHDVKELIATFVADASHRGTAVTVHGIDLSQVQVGSGH